MLKCSISTYELVDENRVERVCLCAHFGFSNPVDYVMVKAVGCFAVLRGLVENRFCWDLAEASVFSCKERVENLFLLNEMKF